MKNNSTKYIIIVLTLALGASLTATSTYAYFAFGEIDYGRFLDSSGNVIEGKGDGDYITDAYIDYYEVEKRDDITSLESGEVSIYIGNSTSLSGIYDIDNKFKNFCIIYSINNEEWSSMIPLADRSFNLKDFSGGTFQFKIIATRKSDNELVSTNVLYLINNSASLYYKGTNDYLGTKNFSLYGAKDLAK